jgi:DNA recombination protein RmuC
MLDAQTDDSRDVLRKAFLRDIKKRIDEIHKKYILTQEGTLEYAVMFVPGEGVFQEISQIPEATEYARSKQVYIAGPNSLHLMLKGILISLRGQQMNKMAGQLLSMIGGMKKESDKFGDNLDKLGVHIKNAGNMMGTVSQDFGKLRGSIENAANLQIEAVADQTELLP